jgi:hypothetical protein
VCACSSRPRVHVSACQLVPPASLSQGAQGCRRGRRFFSLCSSVLVRLLVCRVARGKIVLVLLLVCQGSRRIPCSRAPTTIFLFSRCCSCYHRCHGGRKPWRCPSQSSSCPGMSCIRECAPSRPCMRQDPVFDIQILHDILFARSEGYSISEHWADTLS